MKRLLKRIMNNHLIHVRMYVETRATELRSTSRHSPSTELKFVIDVPYPLAVSANKENIGGIQN